MLTGTNHSSISIPHDPNVTTVPFGDLPISEHFHLIYEALHEEGILGKLEMRYFHDDVPQFFTYACQRPSTKKRMSFGFGGSEDEGTAIRNAIAEAIEHYCILHEQRELFVEGKYHNLKPNATDPRRFAPFSKTYLSQKKNKKFVVTHNTILNWIEGYSLTNKKKTLLPASLVYVGYDTKKYNEPTIQLPISTGAACGPTADFALYKGLCEIIERDGYMISFLSEMPKKLIRLDHKDKELSDFLYRFRRYDFDLYFFDTTLDNPVFSTVCILVDKSGSGPAICAGLGASFEPKEAIKTAAIESLRRYVSNRNAFFHSNQSDTTRKYSFDWFLKRKQKTWAAPHMIKHVEAMITNAKSIPLPKAKRFKNDKEKVDYITQAFKEKGYEVLYADVTPEKIKKLGLYVIKVLSPEMVPLWHDERYPYLGIRRLIEIPQKMGINVRLDKTIGELLYSHPF